MGYPRVFLDMTIASRKVGRIVIELFNDTTPKAAENFRCLCTGEKGVGKSGKPLCFRGTLFHRVVPEFVAQAGDIVEGNGTGGESIYGANFPDEACGRTHTGAGFVSMANAGPNTNSSQFFITLGAAPWLDGRHVVFGRVVDGMNVVRAIEAAGTLGGRPWKRIVISNCGQL